MTRKHKKTNKKKETAKTSSKNVKSKKPWVLGSLVIIVIAWFLLANNGGSDYPIMNTPKIDRGAEDAPVLIEEFSDLQCPACRATHPILKKILEDYDGKVKWRYYHYPLSYHKYAETAAIGAECANDQGLFWEFTDTVYENQAQMTKSDLIRCAYELGADESFEACINSDSKDYIIKSDMAEGSKREIRGTPSLFVNGEVVSSLSYDVIASMINAELQK